jgi:hypothetical protein
MRILPCLLLLVGAASLASAGDPEKPPAPEKAAGPGQAVLLLKNAWETASGNDPKAALEAASDPDPEKRRAYREKRRAEDELVVYRYAEPSASHVRSDVAASRRIEDASLDLAKAVREKLGPAAEAELVTKEVRATCPLAGATVTMLASKIQGNKATAKFRIATPQGERFFRYAFLQVSSGPPSAAPPTAPPRDVQWKIVLSTIEGTPFDDAALALMAEVTTIKEKTADALELAAKEVASGNLMSRDGIRRRLALLAERERAALGAVEARRRNKGDKRPDDRSRDDRSREDDDSDGD